MTDTPDQRTTAEKLAYSVREFAEAIGIARSTAYELVASGQVEARRIGTKTLILRTEAERFLAELPVREPQ